jgi:hypothetical protein
VVQTGHIPDRWPVVSGRKSLVLPIASIVRRAREIFGNGLRWFAKVCQIVPFLHDGLAAETNANVQMGYSALSGENCLTIRLFIAHNSLSSTNDRQKNQRGHH